MSKRAVVVTGASSGIGRATSLLLARGGFHVFAGVRRSADAESLRAEGVEGLEPLFLDVTEERSVSGALTHVQGAPGSAGLAGLVNNAGIALSGPLECVRLDDLRRQFEVNLFGLLAVTQAFLPLLRRGQGRVVNLSSLSGRIAAPFLGPYVMSKFALEALSDSLRREVRPTGVDVVCVEPGATATPIWEKSIRESDARRSELDAEALALYGARMEAVRRGAVRASERATPVEEVAAVVHRALTAPRPRTRYVVGRDARIATKLQWLLPDRWLDRLLQSRFR